MPGEHALEHLAEGRVVVGDQDRADGRGPVREAEHARSFPRRRRWSASARRPAAGRAAGRRAARARCRPGLTPGTW